MYCDHGEDVRIARGYVPVSLGGLFWYGDVVYVRADDHIESKNSDVRSTYFVKQLCV